MDLQPMVSTTPLLLNKAEHHPYSYEVFYDSVDGLYKAKSGLIGGIDYSDPAAGTVIQNVINALSTGGRVFIKAGTYTLNNALSLKTGISIQGVLPQLTNFYPVPPES